MNRFGMLEGAALLVLASLGAAAQQPAPPTHPAPPTGQQQMPMEREHGMGGMGQGDTRGQGGMGMGMGGKGKGGMMDRMHQGPAVPPSSAHAPAPQGATKPQCPPGTAIQMDEKGQHSCK